MNRVFLHSIIHDVKEKDDSCSLAACSLGSINVGILSQEIKRGPCLWMMYGYYQFKNSFVLKPPFSSLYSTLSEYILKIANGSLIFLFMYTTNVW